MTDRERLRRAFEDEFDLRPTPGLRARVVRTAVTAEPAGPGRWPFAIAAAAALIAVAVLVGPRVLPKAGPVPASTPTAVPTVAPSAAPGVSPTVTRGAMAYDPVRRVAVLFGSGQTWTWDGAHWKRLDVAGPSDRTLTAMAWDGTRLILFGGQGPVVPGPGAPTLGDTWAFDGSKWTQLHPAAAPPPAVGPLMAWDPALGRTVLVVVTGAVAETWTWDGSNWSRVATAHAATGFGPGLGYDPATRRLVMYGDIIRAGTPTPAPVTWVFDGREWSTVPAVEPQIRRLPVLADDGTALYLVGGQDVDGHGLADVWKWSGDRWTQVANLPRGRGEAMAASEPGRVVVYGGTAIANQTTVGELYDTWEFDGAAWRQRAG